MKTLLFAFLFFVSSSATASFDLIMVPGFFSSAVPSPSESGNPWKQPYFSHDIVNQLSHSGYEVFVADNLSPVGSLVENGQLLIQFLREHQMRRPGRSLILLGHSAGGLYSLYAAAHSDLPIEQVIAITTPFGGLKFLDTLDKLNVPVNSIVTRFNIENLVEFKEGNVQEFLARLRFHRPLRLDVFSGYQKTSLAFWDYHYLSRVMIPFQLLTYEKSDGMVTLRSAVAVDVLREANPSMNLQIHSQPLELEHWEYSLDANFSKLFQVTNISDLRAAQQRVYLQVMKQSGH